MPFRKGQKIYVTFIFFSRKLNFDFDKISMVISKDVLMKNSQPSLYGSKHLVTLQTLSHFHCFYKSHHSKVSSFKIIISNYIILLLSYCLTFKSLEKHIPAEFNYII